MDSGVQGVTLGISALDRHLAFLTSVHVTTIFVTFDFDTSARSARCITDVMLHERTLCRVQSVYSDARPFPPRYSVTKCRDCF